MSIDIEATKKALEAWHIRSREVLWSAAFKSEALFLQGNKEGADLVMREAHDMLIEEVTNIVLREAFIKPTMEFVVQSLGLQHVTTNETK